MRLLFALLVACLAVAELAGCENYRDATALSKIHRIVVLVPENYEVFIQPNPPTALGIFGVVGAAVGAGIATPESTVAEITQELRASLRSQNLAYGSELANAVERALRADGFEVVTRPVPHPNNEFLTNYSSYASDGDAVMDLIYTAGFRQSRLSPDTPWVVVQMKLVAWPSGETVFSRMYDYSGQGHSVSAIGLDADARYDYQSLDEIPQDPARAAAGLRAALPLIAEDLHVELKRN